MSFFIYLESLVATNWLKVASSRLRDNEYYLSLKLVGWLARDQRRALSLTIGRFLLSRVSFDGLLKKEGQFVIERSAEYIISSWRKLRQQMRYVHIAISFVNHACSLIFLSTI